MNHSNKIVFYCLIGCCLLVTIRLHSMAKQPESVFSPEYRTVTPEAMLHYCAIKKIVQSLWDLINAELKKPSEDTGFNAISHRRDENEINPFSSRTKQGIYLHIKNHAPHHLHTPWGELILLGDCSYYSPKSNATWDSIINKLFSSAISTYLTKKYVDEHNNCTEYHSIHYVNGKQLPAPASAMMLCCGYESEPSPNNIFLTEFLTMQDHNTATKVWSAMETEYQSTTH